MLWLRRLLRRGPLLDFGLVRAYLLLLERCCRNHLVSA